ncbi:uncharacterized protein E1O_18670 [Burkholderiales bacterium GJ-E10]|nr:uncharacterized protein E1O_18670 [Burkholderiales bacterium GJ-E10]
MRIARPFHPSSRPSVAGNGLGTAMRVLVFAKAPRAGSAKTRLIPALGAQGAARLAQRLLDDALARAHAAAIGPVTLCIAPEEDPFWKSYDAPPGTARAGQGDGDLGARMARVAERTIARGESVLLIGTDCPALDVSILRRIADEITHADGVLVPAHDGGYVALGLKRFDPSLFSGIAWGTSRVASATRARYAQLGWTLRELPALPDIDEPHDLCALPAAWARDRVRTE